ncbi:hypothetical protein JIN84_06450 [Luteolibacter yonseiensis]|uniref:SLA1 homology domain-containing protein n=1 Tax=Luteolibacter yonseiensis TaxID=1144680 RepID=A0A934R4R6_9BACT|nr:hypothetical protein [Luteolibacter yonseiensis]MBK1815245.1 hypothetical protein [Luteolibacter yonseiensis]
MPTKLLVLFLTLAAGNAMAAPRVWTSTDGRELTGTFVKADATTVTVTRDNGKSVTIPLTQLTADDQKFVTTRLAELEAGKAAAEEAAKKPKGSITYKLSDGSEKWPEDRKKRIVDAMEQAIGFLNKHGDFKKEVIANNSPGTPTADANIGGWINWGGSISRRVAIHEIAHTLGIGTGDKWMENIKEGRWTGKHAIAQLQEFDGKDAVLHADRQHFWPYGLNQDSESSKENDLRHIKMVQAMRKDMGMR